jgi:DNA topoisomerase-1
MSKLVIVESPTKARTIRAFLPSGYQVEASMGHVRDLPDSAAEIPNQYKGESWARLGVNVRANFEPLYIVPKEKQKVVKELQEALKQADELILATDEDREGESISWHLLQVLKPKVPIKRMVFHEITREAIQEALQSCRALDDRLVRAQETRRILDRLVGYSLSPLLWKVFPQRKGAARLSAGRVQSVAVKVIVERELQRRAFRKGSYWDLKAKLLQAKACFPAELVLLGGKRLATGQDFDEATGQIAQGRNVVLLQEDEALALQNRLDGKLWTVKTVDERPVTRKPAPPFTTSTLQQEANRKLRLSAQQTMRTAQKLYEEGYITYMRTDSVHLSDQAITAARECVSRMYGDDYLSPKPRQYTTKSKGAQEAHEAIRPSGSTFRLPSETPLEGAELALYDLIWKRTVACQMAEARQTNIVIMLAVEDAEFRASGKRIDFPGFFRAYVEGSDDPEAALEDQEVHLPPLAIGDHPQCESLTAVNHETQPPARFTEASLVKMLESEGIGRPSTYATIINTIVARGYVRSVGNALVPTFTALAVTELLEKNFPELVDNHFTAKMEQTLDEIATGEVEWLPYLNEFYLSEEGLENQVKQRDATLDPSAARLIHFGDEDFTVGISAYGPYVQVEDTEGGIRASLPEDISPADLTLAQVESLIKLKREGPKALTYHPESGDPIYLILGPYGFYVQLGDVTDEQKKPKRTSLPKGVKPEDVTPEMAIGLLNLPRHLGSHPETGKSISVGIGRFGPFVVCDGDYRSLPSGKDILSMTYEDAIALLSQPKKGRGKRNIAPLRELGSHPEDGEAIHLYDGPYGLYVKHGKTNASVPKGIAVEEITFEQALEWIAERQSTDKGRDKGSKSKTTPKTKVKTPKETTKTTTARKKAGEKGIDNTVEKTSEKTSEKASEKATGKTQTKTAKTSQQKANLGVADSSPRAKRVASQEKTKSTESGSTSSGSERPKSSIVSIVPKVPSSVSGS